jgi:energy-coupling factor transporter ATP-binding protein EcfA2
LPDGYGTPVGERGVRLSGGERQRIALARAFLKDAPVLILDEPTSSVDARTEAEILGAMERLMSGRTTFMIAHRQSTLEICDTRLELEHGSVFGTTLPHAGRAWGGRRRTAVNRGLERQLDETRTTSRTGRPARRRRKRVPVPCDPVHHPSVGAWRTIAPPRSPVDRVDRLRAKEKVEIYRLVLGNGATSVIAKRRRSDALLVERTIYESILPRLPYPALRYLGYVRDEDDRFAWLFIEDAGDDPCSLAQHGRLAARWLGTLHGAAAELDLEPSLPELGTNHYLEHLRAARTTILDNFDNPALRADDRGTLRALVSTCELIEAGWNGVEAICDRFPRTLVHGDLVARNLRLRRDVDRPAIVAFDWECSGWGVPAVDVHLLALGTTREALPAYCSTISEYARAPDEDQIRLLSLVGSGFWLLASVHWATMHLPHPRPEKGMATLCVYEQPLRDWSERLAAAA